MNRGPLASARIVLAANGAELFVRNEEHVAAVSVVDLEQLRPLAALARSYVNGAAKPSLARMRSLVLRHSLVEPECQRLG